MAMSFNGFVGLGKESTWGTEVPRTVFLRFLSFDFAHNPNITPLRHSQSRYQHGAMFANYDYKFQGRFEARPDAIGEIFRSMFSIEPVTTNPGAGSAYLHEFIPSIEGQTPLILPYSIEARYGTANVSEVGDGGLPTDMNISWDNNMVFIDVSGLCKKPTTLDTPTALGSYSGDRPLMFHQLTLTPNTFFGDGTGHCVRSGSISIQDATTTEWCNQERFLEEPERGVLNVQIQLQMTFKNMRDLRRFWDEEGTDDTPSDVDAPERALNFTWVGNEIEPGQNYEMGFDFTKLIMQPPQKPQNAGDQILQTVVLNASYDEAESKLMVAHLKNTVPSY